MRVTFGPSEGEVIEAYIDSLSGLRTVLGEDHVSDSMASRHEYNRKEIIARYSQMPDLLLWNQGGNFLEIFLEARTDYIEGKYWSTVALCGMVVESMCKDIAKLRADDPEFANVIGNKSSIRNAINCLKENHCFWIPATSKLMHDIMTDRNDYVHVKKAAIDSTEVLNILVRTSLVVIAEFGLMPGTPGRVARVSPEYFKRVASALKVTI